MFGFGRSAAKSVTPVAAHQLAESGEVLLVDVREKSEWAQGRIAGAVHVPLSQFRALVPTLPSDKPLVFYCLSGARSAQAVNLCRSLGLPHDTHMAGGLSVWRAHGLPLTR